MSSQDLKGLKANYITGKTSPELSIKVAHYSTPAACMSRTADFFFSKCEVCDQTAFPPSFWHPRASTRHLRMGRSFSHRHKKQTQKKMPPPLRLQHVTSMLAGVIPPFVCPENPLPPAPF